MNSDHSGEEGMFPGEEDDFNKIRRKRPMKPRRSKLEETFPSYLQVWI